MNAEDTLRCDSVRAHAENRMLLAWLEACEVFQSAEDVNNVALGDENADKEVEGPRG